MFQKADLNYISRMSIMNLFDREFLYNIAYPTKKKREEFMLALYNESPKVLFNYLLIIQSPNNPICDSKCFICFKCSPELNKIKDDYYNHIMYNMPSIEQLTSLTIILNNILSTTKEEHNKSSKELEEINESIAYYDFLLQKK
jgi:hypothetical protein